MTVDDAQENEIEVDGTSGLPGSVVGNGSGDDDRDGYGIASSHYGHYGLLFIALVYH